MAGARALVAASLVIGAIGGGLVLNASRAAPAALAACRVVDGDTLRCGAERVRLLGIDAPELPGHCRQGRACAPGDPYASTDSLQSALVGSLAIERAGADRYGRTLAMVKGSRGDLSCFQLAHGQAIYKPKWDNGARVAAKCPGAAR